jgi:hypothetical protein
MRKSRLISCSLKFESYIKTKQPQSINNLWHLRIAVGILVVAFVILHSQLHVANFASEAFFMPVLVYKDINIINKAAKQTIRMYNYKLLVCSP